MVDSTTRYRSLLLTVALLVLTMGLSAATPHGQGPAAAVGRAAVSPVAGVSPDGRIELTAVPSSTSVPAGGGQVTMTYTVANRTAHRAYYSSLTDDRCPSPRHVSDGGLKSDSVRWYIPPGASATFTCDFFAGIDVKATSTAVFTTTDGTGVWSEATASASVSITVAQDQCEKIWYSSNVNGAETGRIGTVALTGSTAMRPEWTIQDLTSRRYDSSAAVAVDPSTGTDAYFIPTRSGNAYGGLWRLNLLSGRATQVAVAATDTAAATTSLRLAVDRKGTVWSWTTNGVLWSLPKDGTAWVRHDIVSMTYADGATFTDPISTLASGDLVVGGGGNLWLLGANSATTTTYLIAVSDAEARKATIKATVVGRMNSPTGGGFYTGVAFGPSGRLYASAGSASSTNNTNTLYEVDMSTGRATLVAGAPNTGNGTLGDLGSCSLPRSRLQVLKRASTAQPAVRSGDEITYQIEASNLGALASVDVTLQDAIPTSTTYKRGSTTLNGVAVADAAGGVMPYTVTTAINGPGTNRPGIIPPGETAVVRFTVTVNDALPATVTTIANRATVVDINNPDGKPSDDPASPGESDETVVPIARAAIRLEKTASTTAVEGGGDVTYTYRLANTGSEPLDGVTLVDTATRGGAPVSPYACAAPTYVTGDDNGDGRLDPFEQWAYTCQAAVAWGEGDPAHGVTLRNTATVTAAGSTTGARVTDTTALDVTVTPRTATIDVSKRPGTVTGPDSGTGDVIAAYSIVVRNSGQVAGSYGPLIDTPTPPKGMAVTSMTVMRTDNASDSVHEVTGGPTYPVTTGTTSIAPGATHRYRVRVTLRWTTRPASPALTCSAGGGIRNTASLADGQEPDAGTADNTACLDAPEPPHPAVSLVKTATDVPNPAKVGQEVTYRFRVTNNSPNIDLTDVRVTDPKVTSVTCPTTTLPAGESTDCTGTAQLTQPEVDAGVVRNTATATATPAGFTGTVTDTSTVDLPLAPNSEVKLEKTGALGADKGIGGTVTYTFTITNTGSATLTNVRLTDPLLGLTDAQCGDESLAPNGKTTCEKTYTLTRGDVEAGEVTNTATVAAVPPSGSPVRASADATVPGLRGVSSVEVVKSAGAVIDADGSGDHSIGDTIWYAFRVRNTGTTPLTTVTVTDAHLDPTELSCADSLAPGQSVSCRPTRPYTLTEPDLRAGRVVNSATVTATAGGATLTATSNTVTTPVTYTPKLLLTKTAGALTDVPGTPAGPSAGDTIPYTFTVTNPSPLPLANLTITDPLLGGDITCPDTVPARGSVTCTAATPYTVTIADIDARAVVNTATATADDVKKGKVTDDATVTTPLVPVPAISLTKTHAGAGPFGLGQTITYTFTVTNTGAGNLSHVTITDERLGMKERPCPTSDALAPGATATCAATYTVTQADLDAPAIVNTATATALSGQVDGHPATRVTATATDTSPTQDAQGRLSVVKSADPVVDADTSGTLTTGDKITYRFTVTNTGNATLRFLAIDDPRILVQDMACGPRDIAPGERIHCEAPVYPLTGADIASGHIDNTARARAVTTLGQEVSAETQLHTDLAVTPGGPPPASLNLVKTATLAKDGGVVGAADVGDDVSYTFTVRNGGGATLTGVTVTDTKLAAAGITVTCPATLPPGGTADCTPSAAYRVTQADASRGATLTNTATASGTRSDGGGSVTSEPAPAALPVTLPASLILSKTAEVTADGATAGALDAGDTITYRFVVTTGPAPLTKLTIADPMLGPVTCETTEPAAAARVRCTASPYTVTAADAVAGAISNTATATAVGPDGAQLTASATAVVGRPTPAVALTKTAALSTDNGVVGAADVGDVIAYTFVVTNTGNLPLTQVAVTDPTLGAVTCRATTLRPGAETTCTGPLRTVTPADVAAGTALTNTATVTGTPPSGPAVSSDPATATVPMAPAPVAALELLKGYTYADGRTRERARVGDAITYAFTIVNRGNVAVADVSVSDPRLFALGVTVTCPRTPRLDPGAQVVCAASSPYVVTAADARRGSVPNTAVAKARTIGGTDIIDVPPPNTPSDSITIPVGTGTQDPDPGRQDPTAPTRPRTGGGDRDDRARPGGRLARTGADVWASLLTGLTLLGAGAVLATGSRRRRR